MGSNPAGCANYFKDLHTEIIRPLRVSIQIASKPVGFEAMSSLPTPAAAPSRAAGAPDRSPAPATPSVPGRPGVRA